MLGSRYSYEEFAAEERAAYVRAFTTLADRPWRFTPRCRDIDRALSRDDEIKADGVKTQEREDELRAGQQICSKGCESASQTSGCPGTRQLRVRLQYLHCLQPCLELFDLCLCRALLAREQTRGVEQGHVDVTGHLSRCGQRIDYLEQARSTVDGR